MKRIKKNNEVYIKKNGNYSKKGLKKQEIESLNFTREKIKNQVSNPDNYIIAYFSKYENLIYFGLENHNTTDDEAILI